MPNPTIDKFQIGNTTYDFIDSTARNTADAAVPQTRKVNNKALSADVTLTSDDIGYDSTETYSSGTIGNELTQLSTAIIGLSGTTRNLFDIDTIPYERDANGYFSRTAKQLNDAYRYSPGFSSGITFEENTQYAVSLTAYTTGTSSTSGNGLRLYIHYSDNSTATYVQWANNVSTPTRKTLVSNSGKTISYVGFEYASQPNNVWYIKDTQIEKGTSATDYIQHTCANDVTARDRLDKLESVYPYDHPTTNAVALGDLSNGYVRKDTGEFTSNSDYRCTGYIPIIGSKIYMMVAYPTSDTSGTAFYDANKNFLQGYGAEQLGTVNTIAEVTPPDGSAYIRMTRRNSSSYNPMALYIPFLAENITELAKKLIENVTGDPTNPLSEIIQTGGQYGTLNKVGIIGDSLAVGGMNTIGSQTLDPDVEKTWYSWPKILERMTGVTTQVFAHGGYNTGDWLTTYGSNADFISNWCMAYIIGLGENDRSSGTHHLDLGTESDVSTTSRAECGASYYGNLANIVLRCKEAVDKARIFMLTNPRPEGESSGYNTAVRYVANAFGTANNVFLVDLYTYAHEIYAQYITDQNYWYGGHLTAIGYRMAAYHISTYIDWIIRNNPRAFRDIQFVTGTE